MRPWAPVFAGLAVGLGLFASWGGLEARPRTAFADGPPALDRAAARASVARAVAFLQSAQSRDGAFRSSTYGLLRGGASVTALAVYALARVQAAGLGDDAAEAALERATAWLGGQVGPHGAIGEVGEIQEYPVYASALWLASGRAGAHAPRLAAYLAGGQVHAAWGFTERDPDFGGWGYRGHAMAKPLHQRVDISQTAFALEALAGSRLPEATEARARALVFLGRCQALEGAAADSQDAPRASDLERGFDGGFAFCAVDIAYQKTPRLEALGRDGLPRYESYGSATADGVLALLAAGVAPDDRRVRESAAWLARRFLPDRNPGFAHDVRPPLDRGMVLYWSWRSARALARLEALGHAPAHPKLGDWRASLSQTLRARQAADGSWRNEVTLMKEDDPLIATPLVILALLELLAE